MILIGVSGGTKSQRELTERAARFMISELLPRKRKITLDIFIRNIKEQAMGYCEHVEKDFFELTIHGKCSIYEYLTTLAHELTHLKQYSRRELVIKLQKVYWKGEELSYLPYRKQPWEMEANKTEAVLAKKFITEELGITVKNSKTLSSRRIKCQEKKRSY